MNMSEIIRKILDNTSILKEKPAFYYYENEMEKVFTYNDLNNLIKAFSKKIQGLEIQSKKNVIIVGNNSPYWPAAYLSAHVNGFSVVHGDVFFTSQEFDVIEKFTEPAFIICERSFSSFFSSDIKKIYFEDIKIESEDPDPDIIPLRKDQPMSIIFTSGTTGDPKGVMLSEENLLSNINTLSSMNGLITSRDRIISVLPFHHVYPFACTVLAPLYFGASLILPKSMKGEDVFGAIKKYKGTILIAVPRLLELFSNSIFKKAKESSWIKRKMFGLFFKISKIFNSHGINAGKILFSTIHKNFTDFRFFSCGGARLDSDLQKELNCLGFNIVEAYGLTETAPIAAINSFKNPVVGSCGKAAKGVSIKILPIGLLKDHGEICIKGPNVMMGYLNKQAETRKAITDGWFHSGDIGYIDKCGNVFITGRKKEIIVLSNGKNIYPEELEKQYIKSEKIKELCIMLFHGEKNTYLTAVVFPDKEYIVKNKIVDVYQEIKFEIENLSEKLPAHKRVNRIEIVENELPKTSLGKFRRYKIEEIIKEKEMRNVEKVAGVFVEDEDAFLHFVRNCLKFKGPLNYADNLETDLGFDSLGKLEFYSLLEKRFNFKIDDRIVGNIFTLNDIRSLLPSKLKSNDDFKKTTLSDALKTAPVVPFKDQIYADKNMLFTILRFIFYIISKIILKCLFRIKLTGKENLLGLKSPFIIAPNHNSFVDGFVMYAMLPFGIISNSFFISLPKYFDSFPISLFRKIFRVVLTGTHDTTIDSLKISYAMLKKGMILCVFPEGKRSLNGVVDKAKKGIGHVAELTMSPIIPVYISGTEKLYSRKNPGLHMSCIKIHIFEQIKIKKDHDILLKWQETLSDYGEKEK